VCLTVCLFVDTIAPESFSGHDRIVERADKFENGYIGVRGW